MHQSTLFYPIERIKKKKSHLLRRIIGNVACHWSRLQRPFGPSQGSWPSFFPLGESLRKAKVEVVKMETRYR